MGRRTTGRGKKEGKLNGCLRYWPAFLPGRLAHRACTPWAGFPARADSWLTLVPGHA